MAKSVTVTFGDGTKAVYQNVPDSVTPEQVEAQANQDYPDLRVTELAGGDPMLTEMRDAIAGRTATMQDLREIATAYNRQIPNEDAAQAWLDYAKDYPDFEIPQDVITPPVGRAEAFGTGFMRSVQSVADVVTGFAGWLADKFDISPADAVGWAAENLSGYSPEEANRIAQNLSELGSFKEIIQAGSEARAAAPNVVAAQTQRGPTFTAGQIAGEVAVTAPAISVGGAGLARLGTVGVAATEAGTVARTGARAAQQVGRAVQTGGTGVRAPTRVAVAAEAPIAGTRTGRMALRVGGGTTAGVAAGALTDQDLLTSAVAGGGIPIVGTIARRGAGTVYDALRGRLGEVRAAEVMRNVIAENATAITQALRDAPANIRSNTAQFLAERGLLTPELAAVTNIASRSTQYQPLLDVAQLRAGAQGELTNVLRGGQTMTEGERMTNAMRQQVRAETDPLRQEALAASDVGRTQMIPNEEAARQADALAAEINQSGIVRNMRGLEERAAEQAEIMGDMPAIFPDMERIQQTRGVAGAAGKRADEGIESQLALRDQAQALRRANENLAAQGLQPLNIGSVTGRLRQQAREAQYVNPQRHRILTEFADNLDARARQMGGVIDASSLYELRKGMSDRIADILGPVDPSSLNRRTAEIIGDVKPLIDNAITEAGGSGWNNYLRRYEAGMRDVERAEFSRQILKLTPQRRERVMSGNDPDYVRDFFGPGRFDVNVEMFGGQLPVAQRLATMEGAGLDVAATGLRNLAQNERGPLAVGVRRGVQEAVEPGLGMFGRGMFRVTGSIPGVAAAGARAGSAGIEEAIANRMANSTMRSLAPALASPTRAARLLDVRSASGQIAEAFLNRMSPEARTAMIQTAQQIMQGQPNAPQSPVVMGYVTNPDGTVTPQYAYPASNAMTSAGIR